MAPKEHMLAQLTAAAQHAKGIAIAWHAIFLLIAVAVLLGWRPSRRFAGGVLAVMTASVSMVSADVGASFNAVVFGALTVVLGVLAFRESARPAAVERSALAAGAAFALVVGFLYPHFLGGDLLTYAVAAPVGVVPCATLYAAIGLALLGFAPANFVFRLVLAAAGLFYGVFGALRLGVWTDLGLIAVALLLAAASVHLQLSSARRRVRAMRTVFSVFVLAIAAGCGSHETTAPAATPTTQTQAQAGLPDRDPALAHKLVAEGAVLIDVRSPEEYAERHIQGAVNVPVDQVESSTDQVSKLTGGDTHKSIVVYCGSGHRAGRAKAALVSHGFDRVTNLGGIDDWDKSP